MHISTKAEKIILNGVICGTSSLKIDKNMEKLQNVVIAATNMKLEDKKWNSLQYLFRARSMQDNGVHYYSYRERMEDHFVYISNKSI